MGQFSWLATDTGEQIYNDDTEAQTVTMVFKDTNKDIIRVTESDYEGYGDFGGVDFYDAVCMMNDLPIDRNNGIDLWFAVEENRSSADGKEWPQLYLDTPPNDEDIDFSIMCKDDPNQGWGCEDDDDDEEDYEEDYDW